MVGTLRRLAPYRGAVVFQRGLPMWARLDPSLLLPAEAERMIDTLHTVLDDAGIGRWSVPGTTRTTLAVAADDRDRLVAALAADARVRQWYRLRLDRRGGTVGVLHPAGAPLAETVTSVVLWDCVAARPDSTFLTTDRDGVVVQLWQRDEDDPTLLRAGSYNGVLELARRPSGPADQSDRDPQIPAQQAIPAVPSLAASPHITQVQFPVDLVYTWVDDTDPAWRAAREQAVSGHDATTSTERSHDDSRFSDHDELRYSLRSVEQFAPWVHHIWVVTAGQRPPWLAEHPKVTVVDHRTIFPDPGPDHLPTFNSHAIEACLHRIPGLAEHFVYLNDDMFFGRTVRPEQFFHPSGIGKFFWSRALVDYLPPGAGEIASTTAAKNARTLISEAFGVTFSQKFYHAPYPLTVSVCAELEHAFPEALARTRAARFRTIADVAAAGSLFFNFAYVTGRSVPSRIRYEYCDPATEVGARRMAAVLAERRFDCFCINDGHTAESVAERAASDRRIRRFLDRYLPVPSGYETTGS